MQFSYLQMLFELSTIDQIMISSTSDSAVLPTINGDGCASPLCRPFPVDMRFQLMHNSFYKLIAHFLSSKSFGFWTEFYYLNFPRQFYIEIYYSSALAFRSFFRIYFRNRFYYFPFVIGKRKWTNQQMMTALIENRFDTIRYLLADDMYFDMKNFLTIQRLNELYNSVSDSIS